MAWEEEEEEEEGRNGGCTARVSCMTTVHLWHFDSSLSLGTGGSGAALAKDRLGEVGTDQVRDLVLRGAQIRLNELSAGEISPR